MAGLIDARVKTKAKSGVDDLAVFTDMADYLPAFKRLMDTSTGDDMDQLAARYAGYYRYAKILEAVAARIRSGKCSPEVGPPGDLTWTSDLTSNDAYDIMLLHLRRNPYANPG